MKERIRSHIQSSIETKQKIFRFLIADIEKAARMISRAIRSRKKILFFGNGGSASDSQHLAAEFVGRFERDRAPLAALALTTDTSVLTAVSNDFSFDRIFERQVEALGRKGDVAVGITTSGNSKNVIRALERSKAMGLKTIVLTGKNGGEAVRKADCAIVIPSMSTSRIQESHILIGHIICDIVDEEFFA